jgi:hypothetical protein
MGLFAAAMIVNAALVIWVLDLPAMTGLETWLARTPAAPPSAAQAAAPDRAAAPPAEDRSSRIGSDRQEPPAALASARSRETGAAAQEPAVRPRAPVESRPDPARLTRVALNELPQEVRARFPGIAFSTHIYAEDADLRAVVANGRKLKEGDRVRGVEIVEITATGVLLAFERYRVDVPIVTDWDAL